jgi:hypothetical protein
MPNWKKILVSGSDASLNTLVVSNGITGSLLGTASFAISSSRAVTASYSIFAVTSSTAVNFNVQNSFTASGLFYPTADNGEESFMQTDGNGNLSLQYVKTLYEEVYNGESFTLLKGTPVYVSGSVGAAAKVFVADPTNPSKMPAVFIIADNVASGDTGKGIVLGLIKGVDTTGYPAGTEIYLGAGGSWTSTRPTGSAIVQVLGYITKEGAGGQGVVLNPGPSNLPNIQSGYVWVGNNNSYPIATSTSSLMVTSASFATTASFAISSSRAVTSSFAITASYVTGSIYTSTNPALSASFASTALSSSFATTSISSSFASTASFVANSLITASVSSNTITFTKGNGTTFPITVATGSAAPAFPFTGSAGITGSLTVVGPVSASAVYISGSAPQRLVVIGSGSASPIFTVQGSQGELFSVTDSLSGSLFSVNDISGLPILEVFSDNTILMGDYQDPMLLTTKKVTQTNSGSFTIYSIPTASYDGAFIDYTIKSGSNARAGTIMSTWAGSSIEFTEVDTMDIGSTTAVGLTMILSGSNAVMTGSSSTGAWTIRTIIRAV